MNANISNAGRQFLGILKGLQIDGREPVRPQMAVFAHGPDGIPRHWMIPDEVTEGWPRFRMNPVPDYLIHAEAMLAMTDAELELAKAETCTLGFAELVDGEEYAIIRYRRPDGKIISTEETDSRYLKTEADGIPASFFQLSKTIPAYRLTASGLRLLTENTHPPDAIAEITESATAGVGKRRKSDSELSASRVKAKAAHDWAMSEIPGAEDLTITDLFDAIMNHPSNACDALPPNAETFGKYLREAGVKRYGADGKPTRKPRSVRRSREL